METRLPSIVNASEEFQQSLSFMVIKGSHSRGTYVFAFEYSNFPSSIFICAGESQMAVKRIRYTFMELGPRQIMHIKINRNT